jgi:hypothetical protein
MEPMQEKEGPRRLQLVEGSARIDRDHRAILGVLADAAEIGSGPGPRLADRLRLE